VKRRCGFLAEEKRGPKKLVWVRGRVSSEECPKSLVTPGSVELLERFLGWKLSGGEAIEGMPARVADAFLVLEAELRTEAEAGR
jgi:hypothetical protein